MADEIGESEFEQEEYMDAMGRCEELGVKLSVM